MTKEIIDKCLDFAEGNKGKFTILTTKKPNFPDTLIEGTERQQIIKAYLDEGYTTRETGAKMGCTSPNIVEQMRQYKKSVAFHGEWCSFWEFATSVRQTAFADAFCGVLQDNEIEEYLRKDVLTVGDFLRLTVTMSTTALTRKLNTRMVILDATKKAVMFGRIKQMCYDVLSCSEV